MDGDWWGGSIHTLQVSTRTWRGPARNRGNRRWWSLARLTLALAHTLAQARADNAALLGPWPATRHSSCQVDAAATPCRRRLRPRMMDSDLRHHSPEIGSKEPAGAFRMGRYPARLNALRFRGARRLFARSAYLVLESSYRFTRSGSRWKSGSPRPAGRGCTLF